MRDVWSGEQTRAAGHPALRLLPATGVAVEREAAGERWWERLLRLAMAPGLGSCGNCGSERWTLEQGGGFGWTATAHCRGCGERSSVVTAVHPDEWPG
ncbi:MAG: hypothetical protein NTZ05_01735 [Chloroflexi bacterium]|nr:hypothetical protein [Chloroflexota bacterium]